MEAHSSCGTRGSRKSTRSTWTCPKICSGCSEIRAGGLGWWIVGVMSGEAMARTGLRMMPTFPSPPLKFRTAGFPQYGFKAGLSEGAFPARRPIVAPIWFASLFRAPRFQTCLPPLGVGAVVRLSAAIRATMVALPQGSSLRSGLFCPGPSTLN